MKIFAAFIFSIFVIGCAHEKPIVNTPQVVEKVPEKAQDSFDNFGKETGEFVARHSRWLYQQALEAYNNATSEEAKQRAKRALDAARAGFKAGMENYTESTK